MQQQSNSWLGAFGVMEAPIIEPEASKAKRHGNCYFENKYKETRQLKADILEKLNSGMAGCINVFNALLEEEKIPAKNNGDPMSIKSFRAHYGNTVRTNRVDTINLPRGVKQKQIVDLFDSGVSEPDIWFEHGFDRTHVYNTLIMFGRIEKRDVSNRFTIGSRLCGEVNEMLKTSSDVKFISQKTGASEKYVRNIRCVRRKAVELLNKGKSADEVKVSLKRISRNYARRLEKEVKSL